MYIKLQHGTPPSCGSNHTRQHGPTTDEPESGMEQETIIIVRSKIVYSCSKTTKKSNQQKLDMVKLEQHRALLRTVGSIENKRHPLIHQSTHSLVNQALERSALGFLGNELETCVQPQRSYASRDGHIRPLPLDLHGVVRRSATCPSQRCGSGDEHFRAHTHT